MPRRLGKYRQSEKLERRISGRRAVLWIGRIPGKKGLLREVQHCSWGKYRSSGRHFELQFECLGWFVVLFLRFVFAVEGCFAFHFHSSVLDLGNSHNI
jgi:hypothetical protein